eukprot:gene3801-4326_t
MGAYLQQCKRIPLEVTCDISSCPKQLGPAEKICTGCNAELGKPNIITNERDPSGDSRPIQDFLDRDCTTLENISLCAKGHWGILDHDPESDDPE